ncbi:hypothetical protein HPB48_018355 [Haemaphysalis longicornis]|uniref:Uncharacterized protein n=1 Tax=Haemaphysalis longicornis TaxID=44386 RepID=A0A9J6GCB5_HAELO|nr:hypothetical protein HPB48_018355 [Haemaphysalis longicornis]
MIFRYTANALTVSMLSLNGIAVTLGPTSPPPTLRGRFLEMSDTAAVTTRGLSPDAGTTTSTHCSLCGDGSRPRSRRWKRRGLRRASRKMTVSLPVMETCQDSTSECELTAIQKRVAGWEAHVRPLLDMEEANSCNVQLQVGGPIEEGMDALQLSLRSREQHLKQGDLGRSSSATGMPPSPPTRKRKQKRKANRRTFVVKKGTSQMPEDGGSAGPVDDDPGADGQREPGCVDRPLGFEGTTLQRPAAPDVAGPSAPGHSRASLPAQQCGTTHKSRVKKSQAKKTAHTEEPALQPAAPVCEQPTAERLGRGSKSRGKEAASPGASKRTAEDPLEEPAAQPSALAAKPDAGTLETATKQPKAAKSRVKKAQGKQTANTRDETAPEPAAPLSLPPRGEHRGHTPLTEPALDAGATSSKKCSMARKNGSFLLLAIAAVTLHFIALPLWSPFSNRQRHGPTGQAIWASVAHRCYKMHILQAAIIEQVSLNKSLGI